MSAVLPRHVLCVLGGWRSLDEVDAIIRRNGGSGFELDRQYSQLIPDSRMTSAFESSYDRVSPSMTADDRRAVREHTAVAHLLSPPLRHEVAHGVSCQALSLTAALLREGGVAVKGESSGIAHGRGRWLELADEYARAVGSGNLNAQGAVLYRAWVRRPLLDERNSVYHSCGMHLLGERDIELPTSDELGTALEWMDLLGLYLAADRPTRPLKDGEGFRLESTGPRRVMRFASCERYATDDFFFNPYGYIRLDTE